MKNARLLTFALAATLTMTVAPAVAQIACESLLRTTTLSQAIAQKLDDTGADVVTLSREDLVHAHRRVPLQLRPDFELVILRSADNKAVLGLVAKRADIQDPNKNLIDQQVVQWQKLDISPEQIIVVRQTMKDGALDVEYWGKDLLGGPAQKTKTTQIVLAKKLEIQPAKFDDVVDYVKSHPRIHEQGKQPSIYSDIVKFLFGKAWVQLFGPSGKPNGFDASQKILKEQRVIVPGKQKFLHVVGEIFHGEITIDAGSPYSGQLAPGRYVTLGRLSSSMKNLELKNEDGQSEPNSLAMGLLIFRSKDQAEVPGLLFLQDSLAPIHNPGLQRAQFTNNPAFAFRPTSIREFFEQGLTVMGVGLASFLSKLDSGRGVQGNYRSAYGAAGNGAGLADGGTSIAPRFIAVQLQASVNAAAHNQAGAMKDDPNAQFILRASDDGRIWQNIGRISNLNWLGVDSHELTFPHGLAGTIDPITLRPASSTRGVTGLLVPTEITPSPNRP